MRRFRFLLLALSGGAACAGDSTGGGEVLVVAEVTISPPGAGLVVGATQQFVASPRTGSGIPVPGRPVTWSSSDERIATVSAGGLLTALTLGEVTVTARVDQAQGTVRVNISPKPVSSVVVEPATASLQVGQSLGFTAVTLGAAGDTLTERAITWLSDAPAIATVAPGGMVTAVTAGTTVIRARAEGKEGSAALTVTPRPATRLTFTTQPANSAAGQAFGPVRVAVQDEIGGTVAGSTAPVTLELSDNPGNVALDGTLTVNAVAGIATFTNLVLTRAAAGYTLRASSGELSPALSSPFTISAGPAAALGITTQPPSTAQSGLPFAADPVVQVQDAHGNPVAQAGVQISAALAGGNATLGGTVTATTGSSGAASFVGLVIAGSAGTYQLRFTATGLTAAISTDIVLAGSMLRIVTQPQASAVNGAPLAPQPLVRITDLTGTPVAQAGVPVTVSLNGTGATLSGPQTVSTDGSGVASFAGLTLTGVLGTFRLVFAAPGFAPVSSDIITLIAGPPTGIRIAVQPPAGAASGAPLAPQPEIQVVDQSGNPAPTPTAVAVNASLASATGTLGGTAVATSDPTGRAVFTNLAIIGPAGSYTLRFSTAALGSVDSDPVTLGAGSPTRLSMAQEPSNSAPSGVAFGTPPAVQLRDGADNPVSLAGVTITAGIASGGGTLIGTPTAITDGSGIATFSGLGISGLVGDRTLQFTGAGLTPVQSRPISITPGAAAQLTLSAQPSAAAASGTPFPQQPMVQVRDAAGNSVAQAGIAVTAALAANAGGTLGGGLLVLTNASGQAGYTDLAITGTSGNYSLRFTATTLAAVESNGILLGAGAGSQLAIAVPPPASVKNGAVFGTTIQLQDGSSNPVAQAGVQIVAGLVSGDPALGGTTSVPTNGSGQAVFSDLTITGPTGERTIIFAATGYSSATSGTITVTPGDPKALAITTQPAGTGQSGVPLDPQPVLRLEDQSGNPVSQAGVQVNANLASGDGSITAGGSAATNGSGVAAFSGLTISGLAGVKILGFAAAGLSGTTSGAITLSAGPASTLAAVAPTSQSAAVNTAVASAPSVMVTDGAGNPVAGVEVTFTVTQGGGTSSPASPAVIQTSGSGVAALSSWTLGAAAGTSNNTVTATANGLQGSPVTFTASATAGPAANLAANSDQDQEATAGTAVAEPPSVKVTDAGGNPVAGVTVTFVVAGGGSIDPADGTRQTDAGGIAALSGWTLGTTAGVNTVTASAAGVAGNLVFTATGVAGAPAQLSFTTTPPAIVASGAALAPQPVLEVKDAHGNPVATTGVSVSLVEVEGGPGTLGGTATVNTVNGIATFTDLTITGPGKYRLQFTAGTAELSADVEVTP